MTAEDAGFALLVTPDHLLDCLSPLAPLVLAAEATKSMRVGTLVLNNDLRHPAVLAREAATIDLLTEGRFELGLGAGHAFPEYERIGLSFDPALIRISRLAEALHIVRRLLDGEHLEFSGDHYQLAGETCFPRPVQEHLPLIVGGGGRRVLALAARTADTVGLTGLGRTLGDGQHHKASGFPPSAVDRQVSWVRKHAESRGRSVELQALVQQVVITDKPTVVAGELIDGPLAPLTVEEVLETPYMMIGPVESLIEKIEAGRERWGISHYTFRSASLVDAAPIVEALAGK